MDVMVRVWDDGDAWVAEAVRIPNATICAASRDEAIHRMEALVADLRDHGLLDESAELVMVAA